MVRSSMMSRRLLAGTAVGAALFGGAAYAQDQASRDDLGIAEVVVTATRQTDTVGRVPLTINAVTQRTLDDQGVKNAADLVRVVPGINTVANPGGAQQTFSIRGVIGAAGAATTSVYLDDTNLTKRSNSGVAQNNGVVAPLLYDLERIEVLKGPQGTLYGGSSEGGTIRYITPAPSLTTYSGRVRGELSHQAGAELSHEIGGAIGGPIVQDKLGFRISGIRRTVGGDTDAVSAYTGKLLREDANSTWDWAIRGSLLWQITDRASAQLNYYHVTNKAEGGSSSQTAIYLPNGQKAPAGQTFTVPNYCVQSITRPANLPLAQPGGNAASQFRPSSVFCTGANAATTTYVRPGFTYGPYTEQDRVNLVTGRQAIVGADSEADVASLTLNYDFERMNVKSITSYLHDKGASNGPGGEEYANTTSGSAISGFDVSGCTAVPSSAGALAAGGCRGFPLFQLNGGSQVGTFIAGNKRYGIEQELRFASTGDSRLQWVAGIYFSNQKTHILYYYEAANAAVEQMLAQFYGPGFTSLASWGVANTGNFQARLEAAITDTEFAGFGEANFWIIPDRLKAIAGVRVSRVELKFRQTNYGQFSGRFPDSYGTLTEGNGANSPVTPKFGLQYQFNDTNMAYVTAAKGFRAGGVNSQISQSICENGLNQVGITASDIPAQFAPDTVWSYEAGGKFRALQNRLQFNAAVYRIDWKGIQATAAIPGCPFTPVVNGGRARSEGVDIQFQYRPTRQLNLGGSIAYTYARYIDAVAGVTPTKTPTVAQRPGQNAGDKLDTPPISLQLNAQYDFELFGQNLFVRADYSYRNRYAGSASFGASLYNANNRIRAVRQQIDLRAGVRLNNGVDVNLFVQNLTNEQNPTGITQFANGRTCASTSGDCSQYSAFNPFVQQSFQEPRRIGIQANYRF
jgi:outer membrane receptor protein involved in Fe transport